MTLTKIDSKRISDYYTSALKRFGKDDPRSVHWSNSEDQIIRYEILLQVGKLSNTSVLDVGCGFGILYRLFLQKEIPVDYTGIDIIPDFIQTTKEKFPGAKFEVNDIFDIDQKFDYVLASGALSFKVDNNEMYYREMIKKMYSLCKKGIAFNMLDRSVHVDNETYASYSPQEIGDFCKTFSNNVQIVTGYLPQDFTVYVYRN
jgi:2-polyprenyl-3-methyl-5-hydroxy-6-metoxy-1,4-benzoquinol methylase